MGFLIPASLLALAFVVGPIVAHLVRRRGVDVRTLPTVRYLHAAATASSRRRRIVDLLLLALRIASVVALALTAAQPFRRLPTSSVGRDAISAVFVIDDSHSMNAEREGTPLVRLAVREALDELTSLPQGSFVSVVAAGAPPRVLVRRVRARDLAEAALRSLEVGSVRGGALAEAIEAAGGAFEPGLARHLFVLSDFAAHEQVRAPAFPRDARAHLVRLRPDATRNRRIVDARVRAAEGDAPSTVEVRVRTGESERGSVEVGLFDGEALVAKASGRLDAMGEGRVSLEAPRTSGSVLEARLLGRGDGLPREDVRHVLLRADDYTRVLVVEGRPRVERLDSASGFFRAALETAPARDGRYAVRSVDAHGLDERVLDEADVVVYADVASPAPAMFTRVLRRVSRGMGLLVSLGEASDPFAYAGLLGSAAPARILAASVGERGGAASAVLAHPPGDLRVTRHFPMTPEEGAQVLLTLSGVPVAVERAHGSGRIALVGLPLDDSGSNFPYLASYLPTMASLVRRLAPPTLSRSDFVGGEAVSLDTFFRDGDELRVETPSGERVVVRRGAPVFGATGEAGVYRVLDVEGAGATFVVRPPMEETELDEGPVPEPPAVAAARSDEGAARADLTPWLALLAALFLAAEGLVRTRAGRQARTEETTRGIPPRSATDRVST